MHQNRNPNKFLILNKVDMKVHFGLSQLSLLALAWAMIAPAYSIGMGICNPAGPLSPADTYCLNHGGCPQSGKCYFPDGSYCDAGSFYNGTCPSKENKEQAMWDAEMYRWLHSDDGFYSPSATYGTAVPFMTSGPSIVLGSGTASYWQNEANKMYLAGYYEQASAAYARALGIDRTLIAAWLNMGHSLYFLGRYNESMDAYNAILGLDPKNPNALRGKELVSLALRCSGR